jgi:hypothetical protein
MKKKMKRMQKELFYKTMFSLLIKLVNRTTAISQRNHNDFEGMKK